MKKAIFIMLDQYADWEAGYLAGLLNQKEDWEVKTASTQNEIMSIGGFHTKVDHLLDELPKQIDLLVLIGGNSWHLGFCCEV
ncbi:MAG: DJ-1/PfpI family protein [Enterococcaceae bacterium]|nr:DJ-1/PfpI family protein [Enterococcaceae bacterium]